ncbi:hypothetical protein TSAR_010963 [Trichomalopsis sarcophagae]|uniref:Uncharacterized protein n=1 Tax=Trichomalopsis sarcophagae TaxID=543379 RepID=A0A232FCC1_9HYME|nr:hypothetical protein TSAR_010963 [Trichomalopsis sarcophagae]
MQCKKARLAFHRRIRKHVSTPRRNMESVRGSSRDNSGTRGLIGTTAKRMRNLSLSARQ